MSITYDQFKTETSRWFPRYRSARMDHVLEQFRLLEGYPSNVNRTLLRKALEIWAVTDPKEYANRDKKSGGLCAQLATELDVNVQQDGSNKNIISAHLLTPSVAGRGATRAVARSAWQKCSIEDVMLKTHEDGNAGTTCVIVIDMQAKEGSQLADAGTQYNSDSVLSNQVSVVEAAAEYGMHVFEVRIAKVLNFKDPVPGEKKIFHNDPTLPELVKAFGSVSAEKFVSFAKPYYNSFQETILEGELNTRGIRLAIVMGFDANLCVKNTIFGTPESREFGKDGWVERAYMQGLLDRGIPVLTSRVVLASSSGAHLDPEYGMTG